MLSWNEFQSVAANYRTEGPVTAEERKVRKALRLALDSTKISLVEFRSHAYDVYKVGAWFSLSSAHSGTSRKEFQKAKKIFLERWNNGEIWGLVEGVVELQFHDVNGKVYAVPKNNYGEEIGDKIYV